MSLRLPRPWKPCLCLGVVVALTVLGRAEARADELDFKFDELVRKLSGVLKPRGGNKIAVGHFIPAARLPASAGPAIAQALTDALARGKVLSDPEAPLELKGDYFTTTDDKTGLFALTIKVELIDNDAGREVLSKPEINLFDAVTVARFTGATGDIAGKNNRERNDKVRRIVLKPTVLIEKDPDGPTGSRIAAPGQPYAIEVLVKEGGGYSPRKAENTRNRAFVLLQKTEVYAVRLINDSPLDAAVELDIDGVNIFSLHRDPEMRKARFVVKAGTSALARGYATSDQGAREFLVAGIDEPIDGRLVPKSAATIGTITAIFSAAWSKGDAPPKDEPDDPIGLDANKTVPGVDFDIIIERVDVEIGNPRATISARYNK